MDIILKTSGTKPERKFKKKTTPIKKQPLPSAEILIKHPLRFLHGASAAKSAVKKHSGAFLSITPQKEQFLLRLTGSRL